VVTKLLHEKLTFFSSCVKRQNLLFKRQFDGHKVAEKKEHMGRRVAAALGSVQHMTKLREIRGKQQRREAGY
jgi:hypothetical protein